MPSKVIIPESGSKISINDGKLNVPNNPIIPYIEGDGIGIDVTPTMIKVVDAAVQKAYGDERSIHWMEVYAGEKATEKYDSETWLPDETLEMFKEYKVGIKGPLTTPVGGGMRSLNVALRQILDCMYANAQFNGLRVYQALLKTQVKLIWLFLEKILKISMLVLSIKQILLMLRKLFSF